MEPLEILKKAEMPLGKLLGIEFTHAEADRIEARMEVRPDLCTIPAVLHGGAIMALADTVGAAGTVLNLPEGAWTSTIESKTNFIGPAPAGTVVVATATPVHRGRKTQVWQTEIRTGEGRKVALVTQTQIVLEKS